MDLYREIMRKALSEQRAEIIFPDLKLDAAQLTNTVCYTALAKIRDIVRDDSLSDPECFEKIEQIILILEQAGSDGGFRHDFG